MSLKSGLWMMNGQKVNCVNNKPVLNNHKKYNLSKDKLYFLYLQIKSLLWVKLVLPEQFTSMTRRNVRFSRIR